MERITTQLLSKLSTMRMDKPRHAVCDGAEAKEYLCDRRKECYSGCCLSPMNQRLVIINRIHYYSITMDIELIINKTPRRRKILTCYSCNIQ